MRGFPFWSGILAAAWLTPALAVERVWLSHATHEPSQVVVNWESRAPGDSVVEFGTSPALGQRVARPGSSTRHQVAIPLTQTDGVYHYRVRTGEEVSEVFAFKGYPARELRLAIVGDWGFAMDKDLSALRRDDPHLLLTVGDNVPDLHGAGRQGLDAFRRLIDAHPALFRSTPFLPILGNHDREITPRGPKPPAHPVYDVEATAFREFFALPGEEWKWHFDVPGFDLRLIALDLNHIQDFGTTWQTCHAWQPDSPQFRWYADTLAATRAGFVLTLMNEKHTQLQGLTQGAWHQHFRRGTALITGFGYFADRALLSGGLPYFNTCLKGTGDLYKDPQSQFHAREDNYLLLTLTAGAPELRVEFKNLKGEVLDRTLLPRRAVGDR